MEDGKQATSRSASAWPSVFSGVKGRVYLEVKKHGEMSEYMKTPCKSCPYRNDVKPHLHPGRIEELACIPTNPYNEFFCHQTLGYAENYEG